MLVQPIGVIAIAAVRGTPAGLHICDAVRQGTEHPQKRLRNHGPGTYLGVVRFLNDAAAIGPVAFQRKDEVLKRLHQDSSIGAVIRRRSAWASICCTRKRLRSAAVDCSHSVIDSSATGRRSI